MTVPASSSTVDPELFAREVEAVFRRNPLHGGACRVDIPDAGDFTTLDIADRPIVVVRGDDGVARTFLNACRHRGAAVVDRLLRARPPADVPVSLLGVRHRPASWSAFRARRRSTSSRSTV